MEVGNKTDAGGRCPTGDSVQRIKMSDRRLSSTHKDVWWACHTFPVTVQFEGNHERGTGTYASDT
jgi:hypothetical protein